MAHLYEMGNATEGMDNAILGVATAVPQFIPMFLFFVYCIVFLGGVMAQRRKTGTSDPAVWSTLASLITLILSLLMTLKDGLMTITTLGIVFGVVILSGAWLFLSKGRGEI